MSSSLGVGTLKYKCPLTLMISQCNRNRCILKHFTERHKSEKVSPKRHHWLASETKPTNVSSVSPVYCSGEEILQLFA